jgi:DNA-binding transcriptional regulator LsrR (DeoR family)
MTSEVKQQQIEWRRTRVLELSSEGYSRSEICQKLQLDRVIVHRDIQFLRQQVNIIKDNPNSQGVSRRRLNNFGRNLSLGTLLRLTLGLLS